MKFSVEQIDKDGKIFMVKELYYEDSANMFLFKGKRFDVLFDCGLGLFDVREHLKTLGFTNVKVALTHSHFDHTGGLKYFPAQNIITRQKTMIELSSSWLWATEYLRSESFASNDEDVTWETINRFCSKFNVEISRIAEYPFNRIDNGSFTFDIIETPGHTDDSLVYFEQKQKILISGDALYQGDIGCNYADSDFANFLRSLDLMQGMNFQRLLPGHNKILDKQEAAQSITVWKEALLKKLAAANP